MTQGGLDTITTPIRATDTPSSASSSDHFGVIGRLFNESSFGEAIRAIRPFPIDVAAIFKPNPIAIKATSAAGEAVRAETNAEHYSALACIHNNENSPHSGIWAEHKGKGMGGYFKSAKGIALRAESFGIEPDRPPKSNPAAIYAVSQGGEAVHGETNSDWFAAVAGIQLNPNSTGAGVWGEHKGDNGKAGVFIGNVHITKNLDVDGDVRQKGQLVQSSRNIKKDIRAMGGVMAKIY